ncbi:hypothetical protein Megvenef_01122 [Candidatus Megaera venefica]|uniref:DUF5681 domain-containing protein n=1 Tax=Candidatus Megaera venefica TaxID=2055910 RepID=A0ABU5NDB0_9RICK|nr:DUF5681 domain-containing protein [Candidatus Megaera venefica]MEA0971149.1 hypothetical protein [Candidatus Megaera venefica]
MKFTKGKSGNPKGRPKTTDTSIRELVSRDSIKEGIQTTLESYAS